MSSLLAATSAAIVSSIASMIQEQASRLFHKLGCGHSRFSCLIRLCCWDKGPESFRESLQPFNFERGDRTPTDMDTDDKNLPN